MRQSEWKTGNGKTYRHHICHSRALHLYLSPRKVRFNQRTKKQNKTKKMEARRGVIQPNRSSRSWKVRLVHSLHVSHTVEAMTMGGFVGVSLSPLDTLQVLSSAICTCAFGWGLPVQKGLGRRIHFQARAQEEAAGDKEICVYTLTMKNMSWGSQTKDGFP